jgi:hypothetical protein
MSHPLDGPRAKVERANHHIRDLVTAVGEFRRVNPDVFIHEHDAKSKEWVIRANIRRQPNSRVSTALGDAVHNLRSALDILACQFVETAGNPVTKHTGFPIGDGSGKYETYARRKVKGARKEAVQFVLGAEAYPGGNDFLVALNEVDILDKHRLLLTVVSASHGLIATTDGIRHQFLPFPDNIAISLEHGEEVMRLAEKPYAIIFDPKKNVQLVAEIAFGDTEIVMGNPIVPFLLQMSQWIGEYIERAAPLFELSHD